MLSSLRTAGMIVPFGLCLLPGCFSLSRTSPALEQYVLGAAAPDAVSAPGLADLTIGMRQLDLAPYLATPAITVRRGAHQIVVSEFHRWAENPRDGISRAIAGYLAGAAPFRAVDIAPWSVRTRHDFLIQLHVSRFEGVAPADTSAPTGEAHLAAGWEVLREDGALLARGATDFRAREWSVGDYAQLVTLLNRGLAEVARDLARCLEKVVAANGRAEGGVEPIPERGAMLTCTA